MADINLITEEQKEFESFDNIRKKLSVVSVVLLVITALGTIGTLGYFTTLISARGALVERVEAASQKVNGLQGVEELIVVTKEKASVADQIISKRSDKVKIFNALATLVPQSVSFSDIKVTQGKIVISGRAKTSVDIAAFISALASTKGAEILTGVSVDSLSSDENGVYSFGVSANLVR